MATKAKRAFYAHASYPEMGQVPGEVRWDAYDKCNYFFPDEEHAAALDDATGGDSESGYYINSKVTITYV